MCFSSQQKNWFSTAQMAVKPGFSQFETIWMAKFLGSHFPPKKLLFFGAEGPKVRSWANLTRQIQWTFFQTRNKRSGGVSSQALLEIRHTKHHEITEETKKLFHSLLRFMNFHHTGNPTSHRGNVFLTHWACQTCHLSSLQQLQGAGFDSNKQVFQFEQWKNYPPGN